MLRESNGDRKSSWGGLVSPSVALATVLFTATGFLATRAYLNGLGIPEHVVIPVDVYIQYGGRFLYGLAVQLLPASFCAGLIGIIGAALTGWIPWLRRLAQSAKIICAALVVLSIVTIALELSSLNDVPLFSPGHIRSITAYSTVRLFFIEIGGVLTVVSFFWQLSRLRHECVTLFQKILFLFLVVVIAVEILIFPLCFGQIAMVPKYFDRVSMHGENQQTSFQGILVFTDADSFFLFTPDARLVELSRHSVKDVQYESREYLENLATK